MELPEEQYYGLNRIFLSLIGLWPYDDIKTRFIRIMLWLLICSLMIVTQVLLHVHRIFFIFLQLYVKKILSNILGKYHILFSDLILNILTYNLLLIACSVKYITFFAVCENIKDIRACIRSNWNSLKDNQENEIICKHGLCFFLLKKKKLFAVITTYYTTEKITNILPISVSFGSVITAYILIQYSPILFDIIMPLNTSRPRKLLFDGEYFIDSEKYFFVISIHMCIGLLAELMCATATESFTLANAVHAFGLFKIASYRMKHVLDEVNSTMCATKKYFVTRNKLIAAVDFHRRALEFSELLRTSFGPAYIVLIVLGICSTSINLFHIIREIMADNKEVIEIIKSAFLIVVNVIYFVLGNYAGQEFINSDTLYYNTICKTNWYNAPIKTQKLILFILQKTTKCYKVDAAGMFIACLEGLATVRNLD
ncbi:uncharacterized protein [Cardiocondyla obscurior]|uniref:uncharacterized protein n=1 Tax=Cardiocondyla obscurior TaxID=286306 RepID=UPI0039658372